MDRTTDDARAARASHGGLTQPKPARSRPREAGLKRSPDIFAKVHQRAPPSITGIYHLTAPTWQPALPNGIIAKRWILIERKF